MSSPTNDANFTDLELEGKKAILEESFHDVGLEQLLKDQHDFISGLTDRTSPAQAKSPFDILETCQREAPTAEIESPAFEQSSAKVSSIGLFGPQKQPKPEQPEQKQDIEPPKPK